MSFYKGSRTLSVMQTYTCPAACDNCGTYSSPSNSTTLGIEKVLDAIEEAKNLGFANVVFTGGETTLKWNNLLLAIERATSLGLPTRIVTNAHWASSLERSKERVCALIDAGLKEINFSTGDEHVKFVPIQRVIFGCIASLENQLPVHVMVENRKDRTIDIADILNHPLILALSKQQLSRLKVKLSPWMPLDPSVVGNYDEELTVNRHNLAMRTGCSNILSTYTIKADGTIGSCCGIGMLGTPELTVANVTESDFLAKAVQKSEDDFLKIWLHYIGPEKILAWAASKDSSIKWENFYAHHCQACHRIYKDPQVKKCIRENYEEIIAEVFQSAWLDEDFLRSRLVTAQI